MSQFHSFIPFVSIDMRDVIQSKLSRNYANWSLELGARSTEAITILGCKSLLGKYHNLYKLVKTKCGIS